MKTKKSYNVKIKFKLDSDELKKVREVQRKGVKSARIVKRAQVLELFHNGLTSPTISEYAGVRAETARRIAKNYFEGGLKRALYDLKRPGKKRLLSPSQKQEVAAIACSDPPEGCSKWTIEMIREEIIRKKICPSIGSETVRIVLKKNKMKPWREKNVVRHNSDV